MVTDLNISVWFALVRLVAEGENIVNPVYHLDRGCE
jgi:UDP-N-acetylglucosamine enolpyruvyl transferase